MLRQCLGLRPRDEYAGVYIKSQPAEIDPAEHVLESFAGDPARDQRLVAGEQCGLVLREDRAGRAQALDDVVACAQNGMAPLPRQSARDTSSAGVARSAEITHVWPPRSQVTKVRLSVRNAR